MQRNTMRSETGCSEWFEPADGLQHWGQQSHKKPTCTHTQAVGRDMRAHVCQYLQACVNVCSTTPSCLFPPVWASALHNSLFLCVGLAACVRVIHCFTAHTWDGSQWRSTALYNSFRPHKIFFFFWQLPLQGFFFCFCLALCILLLTRPQMPLWLGAHHVRSADVCVCAFTMCRF